MIRLEDPVLYETFTQYPAWQTLVARVTVKRDPQNVDPLEVSRALAALPVDGWARLAHAMCADNHADTLDEAVTLIGELRALADCGRRPRHAAEVGIDARPR